MYSLKILIERKTTKYLQELKSIKKMKKSREI